MSAACGPSRSTTGCVRSRRTTTRRTSSSRTTRFRRPTDAGTDGGRLCFLESPPMPSPLLIVDGDSIVFRAFFALPASIKGADGRPVNALLGAANLILRVGDDHVPRAVVVCFGQEAAHYRKEAYEPYHAARPELDEDLAHQYTLLADWLASFGWTVAKSDTLEADDLLASYAEAETERGGRALIMTG